MIDGIESAYAKARRALVANEKSLDVAIRDYFRSKPCKMIPKSEGKEALEITSQPPIQVPILIGEFLYQCRSALDHLFFELVRKKGTPNEKNWEEHCQFPLAKSSASFPGKLKDWFPEPVLTTLERMQPYRRGNDLNDTLRYLRILSNIDKHRKLSVAVTRVDVHDSFIASSGTTVTIIHPMLNDGAELAWPEPIPINFAEFLKGEVDVKRKLIPVVAFDEPQIGRPEDHPVKDITHHLPSLLIGYIIPVIEDLISKP